MIESRLLEILNKLVFSASLPETSLADLANISKLQEVPSNTLIFREGSENHWVYLIASGHVRLDMFVAGRGNVSILSLGPGDVLAWSALVGGAVMTATATTVEESRLIAMPGPRLLELCNTNHEFGYRFMRQLATALSQRLVATRLQLLDLFKESSTVARPGD